MRPISLVLLFISLFHSPVFGTQQEAPPLKLAIVGLGGRAQWLLLECLKLKDNIQVVAICDDKARESIDYQMTRLQGQNHADLLKLYQASLAEVTLYPNTPEALKRLFAEHKSIETVFITSANSDHLFHLNTTLEYAPGKKIFMEKPLFRSLEEFLAFDFQKANNHNISIGLTLRYASMVPIVSQQLRAYRDRLGKLKSVHIWERLNFKHAFTAFIMGPWRRYVSQSGGFMLEKVIHDQDLALFFLMNALEIEPLKISLTTEAAHQFFIQSNKGKLLEYLKENRDVQTKIQFSSQWNLRDFILYDEKGTVDWERSLDCIFEQYPHDEDFTHCDLIPDYQVMRSEIETASGEVIELKLEVDMAGFRPTTERGQLFTFEKGYVHIDIMASLLSIHLNEGFDYQYELKTHGSDHADGDEHIIASILGTPLPQGHSLATLNDPIVKLANLMILIAEHQVHEKLKSSTLEKRDGNWELRDF